MVLYRLWLFLSGALSLVLKVVGPSFSCAIFSSFPVPRFSVLFENGFDPMAVLAKVRYILLQQRQPALPFP